MQFDFKYKMYVRTAIILHPQNLNTYDIKTHIIMNMTALTSVSLTSYSVYKEDK